MAIVLLHIGEEIVYHLLVVCLRHRSLGMEPYAEYGLWARNKQGDIETNLYKKNEDGDAALKRFNVGAAVTVGYEFKFGLQFNASYKLGVLNSLNKPAGDAAMRPSMVNVGIGYSIFK